MAWKKIPVEEKQRLAGRLRAALAGRRGVTEKPMFGGTCFLLNGHMLCGTGSGSFLFRVGKEAHERALKRAGARAMVHNGRRLEGYLWVDPKTRNLKPWVALAEAHVSTIAPKRK